MPTGYEIGPIDTLVSIMESGSDAQLRAPLKGCFEGMWLPWLSA
jgi:hypothetical protein